MCIEMIAIRSWIINTLFFFYVDKYNKLCFSYSLSKDCLLS